jgi:peptide/nickel transport system ATP-binding protein
VPTPDPARRLDFNQLLADKASDPAAWPEPFRRDPVNPPRLIEIAEGHCVEASAPPVVLPGWAAGRVRA